MSSSSSSPTSETNQIIEHIVLFKTKPTIDSTKTNSMVNDLQNLVKIDKVLHLSAGSIHRIKTNSELTFTHVLHSRYKSKEDLKAYVDHPSHLRVVEELLPIWEDVMAVDWIAELIPGTTLAPVSGSVGKISLVKVKENVSDEVKSEIMEVMIKEESDQVTVGENFSPARANGFSIASITYFKDLSDLEKKNQKDLVMEKVGEFVDDTIVVEFVVPSL
ncbi:hypothetical protein AALP_AA4G046000 [Arabis alpina]|uniref:Stress-response A/B barrel domain-containing protein n=1 Tax=Arabis alpina TaxID=50452 RepID=A0A087H157_ARAAL|nr:hypothetical protein AALP_AA4G046000 [Arabis alpina]